MAYWAAFVLGLAGSLHCVGMCGPIAMALPSGFRTRSALIGSRLLYNLGRTLTYTLLGAFFGLFGWGIALAGYQQLISILLGIMLLMAAYSLFRPQSRLLQWPALNRWTLLLKRQLGKLFGQSTQRSVFAIGLLNGVLPCGFVYVAVVGAATTGSVAGSMLYMFFFGMGTLPLMLATSLAGGFVSIRIRNFFRKAAPALLILFAVLLIARGLNLGIPYISPAMSSPVETKSCH